MGMPCRVIPGGRDAVWTPVSVGDGGGPRPVPGFCGGSASVGQRLWWWPLQRRSFPALGGPALRGDPDAVGEPPQCTPAGFSSSALEHVANGFTDQWVVADPISHCTTLAGPNMIQKAVPWPVRAAIARASVMASAVSDPPVAAAAKAWVSRWVP